MQSLQELREEVPTATQLVCPVCGAAMYATDRGTFNTTFHCSSAEARFWDYDRGSAAQHKAKEHWDKSMREVMLNRG